MPVLNDEDQARLLSCMEEIRGVVGESVTEKQMVETILRLNYDCAKALDEILNDATTKPPKQTATEPIEKGDYFTFSICIISV